MSIPRAFLSHSSVDKAFVEQVAENLGREFCVFDKYCFHAGDDLVDSIEKGMARSSLLVLFASAEALKSDWVRLELLQAQKRKLSELTFHALAIGLTEGIRYTDLPPWLQKSVFDVVPNPENASRLIRNHLTKSMSESGRDVFVGRMKETTRFEDDLVSGERGSKVMVFYGLQAIGRRTLCARLARDLLAIGRTAEISIAPGEKPQDVATTLAALVEPYHSKEEFKKKTRTLAQLTDVQAAKLAISHMMTLLRGGTLTVLVDEGGLVGAGGSLSRCAQRLFEELALTPQGYVGCITQRRPAMQTVPNLHEITTYVEPLSADETNKLLTILLSRASVPALAGEVRAVAEHCKGHPASAHHAAKLAARYGAGTLSQDVRKLVDFRANLFVGYLRESIDAKDAAALLRLLAFYRSLPLRVLGKVLSLSPENLAERLAELIDLALVHVGPDGNYFLSHPIEDAVLRVFGIDGINHSLVATELAAFMDVASPEERRAGHARAIFRAARFSGVGAMSEWALRTNAELLRIGTDLYHNREHERSIPLFREVLAEDASLTGAREYLVRALIQADLYQEATQENRWFQENGLPRDYYFLEGFNLRRQGKTKEAKEAYMSAHARGRQDLKLFRELSVCCMHLNDYAGAEEWIKRARDVDPSNRYVVDLSIQIAIRRHNIKEAKAQLERLRVLDKEEFYWLRRSVVEHFEGKPKLALSSALKAVAQSKYPSFAMLSQLAKCQIETRNAADAAKVIRDIERRFPRRSADVKLGLWCKWELVQGNYANAEGYWNRLGDKSLPVHRALRLDIVRGLLQGDGARGALRVSLQKELEELTESVGADVPRYIIIDGID